MTLHDQLRTLADDVDRAPRVDTAGIARERAVRHRHRWRVVTGVTTIAVLVLLGGVLGLADLRSRGSVDPATSTRTAALPDRLFATSPWLEGTDDGGPLGPLAFAVPASRGTWTGTTPAVVGVSALTGEYRFLDLPDLVAPGAVDASAISPDGRRVAYWATGPTRDTPNTSGGQSEPVGALAVHDAATGETERIEIPSDHGVQPDSLVWSAADQLLLSFGYDLVGDDGPEMDQGSSVDYALYVWRPGDSDLTSLKDDTFGIESAGAGHAVVAGKGLRLLTVPCATCPPTTRMPRVFDRDEKVGPLAWGTLVEPSTGTAAALAGRKVPTRVTVFDDSGRREIPGSRATYDILSFLAPDRLLVRQATPSGRGDRDLELRVLDLENGGSNPLVALDDGVASIATQSTVATALAGRPTFEAVEPPRPLDPRLVAGGLALVVLSGIGYLVAWTRRNRV